MGDAHKFWIPGTYLVRFQNTQGLWIPDSLHLSTFLLLFDSVRIILQFQKAIDWYRDIA